MATIFADTIQQINDSINVPLSFSQWRRSTGDEDPLESNHWEQNESEFHVDLNTETSIADQILQHCDSWGRKHRLSWSNSLDRKILTEIKNSPLPPFLSLDGSRTEQETYTRNSTGAALYTCSNLEDDAWDDATWTPHLVRIMILPEHTGCEQTDNDTGELQAASLAEEILPPSLGAILIADSTTSISTYRTLRDGHVVSNRALVRKIMSGCGKGTVGRLLRNLTHHSQQALHLTSSSSAIHHHYPKSKTPFPYNGKQNIQYQSAQLEEEEEDEQGLTDFAAIIKRHFQQETTRKLDEVAHDTTMPCPIGSIDPHSQAMKMRQAHETMKTWPSHEKQRPYKEEYYDAHPHRPIVKVDSHQLNKITGKPTGRHPQLTPNKALVDMNDLIDRAIDLNPPINFRGNPHTAPIPPDQAVDPHGLRYTFFVDGKAINKSVTKHIWHMENEERRNKQSMRAWHGLIARHEDNIDITPIAISWTGSIAHWMRNMGTCHVRSLRNNITYAYLHANSVKGNETANAKTPKEMKEFLGKDGREGIYQQCPHCGIEDIREFQEATWDGEEDSQYNRIFDKDDPLRGTPLHAQTCDHQDLKDARNLSNTHIETKLNQLFRLADDALNRAYIQTNEQTPTLKTHLIAKLKLSEKEPHRITSNTIPYQRTTIVSRSTNRTIRSVEEWSTAYQNSTNAPLIRDSLTRWPSAIECGIFKPETITPEPYHTQCALDTCIMGWTPLAFKRAIEDWLITIKENSEHNNKKMIKILTPNIMKRYTQVRLAIYMRAHLIQLIVRNTINTCKTTLTEKYSKGAVMGDDEISEGEIDGGLDWEFGPSPDPVHQDSEGEDSSEEEAEPEIADTTQEENPKPKHSTTTKIDCTQIRCRLARMEMTKTGSVNASKADTSCSMCTNFKKQSKTLEALEKICLANVSNPTLLDVIRNPHKKETKEKLKTLLEKDWAEHTATLKIPKKVISRLANTLLVTKHHGVTHHDIDQPLNENMRELYRDQSITMCLCGPDNTTEIPINLPLTQLPQICHICTMKRTLPHIPLNKNMCVTCGRADSIIELLDTGTCRICQTTWLLTQNNSQYRYNQLKRKLEETSGSDKITRAERTLREKHRITDPTIIPKGEKRDSGKPAQLLDAKLARSGVPAPKNSTTATKLGTLWDLNASSRKIDAPKNISRGAANVGGAAEKDDQSYIKTPWAWLRDEELSKAIEKLKRHHDLHIVNSFFHTKASNPAYTWTEARTYFHPEKEGAWKTRSNKFPIPINTKKPLVIPINYKLESRSYNHWIMAARFHDQEESDHDWETVFVDSYHSTPTIQRAVNVIEYRTTLHLQLGQLDLPSSRDPAALNSARISKAKESTCIKQEEAECGLRMILHILLAGLSTTAAEFRNRLSKLQYIDELPQKCRNWVYDIVTTEGNELTHPQWVLDLIQ